MIKTIDNIETSTATMKFKNNILYIVIKEDADVDLLAVKESVKARRKMQGDEPVLVLVDSRKMWQLTKEANYYSASKEVAELSKAMALLTDSSLAMRMITNFFIRMNRQYVPTKMFNSEGKALEWLNTFE
tara:strand:- start:1703 stop:2092 length:390 start_codon:yes stop_codon:yes gene_type:complete